MAMSGEQIQEVVLSINQQLVAAGQKPLSEKELGFLIKFSSVGRTRESVSVADRCNPACVEIKLECHANTLPLYFFPAYCL